MQSRPDISDNVIHFTKCETKNDPLWNLLKIVGDGRLIGSNKMIKGSYQCVCFTEAPLPAIARGLVNANSFTRYSPFGLMFQKGWLYERGARPVIYQSDQEYNALPEELRWRHVRYEPNGSPPVDFTWEREWRLHSDELLFTPNDVVLVVPDQSWIDYAFSMWEPQQTVEVQTYSAVLDQWVPEQMHEQCPWRMVSLAQ